MYYSWLSKALKEEFEIIKRLKESERGTVTLVRHRNTGKRFILRSFTGDAEVYHLSLIHILPEARSMDSPALPSSPVLRIGTLLPGGRST